MKFNHGLFFNCKKVIILYTKQAKPATFLIQTPLIFSLNF
jgi:hypothetical protein